MVVNNRSDPAGEIGAGAVHRLLYPLHKALLTDTLHVATMGSASSHIGDDARQGDFFRDGDRSAWLNFNR